MNDNGQRRDAFITKAKEVHKGEDIDYGKVVYVNNRTPVELFDNEVNPDTGKPYGTFWQTPSNHLKGQSHPLKRKKKISKGKRSDFDKLVKRFNEVHKGEHLDYSQSVYVNMHTKIKIISHDKDADGNEYGEFWQEPAVHLKGCTHPRLSIDRHARMQSYDTELFVNKAKIVHSEDDYDYSMTKYVNSRTKVTVICHKTNAKGQEHGIFYATPDNFLQGKGCPKCGNHRSDAEDELYLLLSDKLGGERVIRGDKTVLGGLELDIYIPSRKVAIEYNGLRWHSERFKDGQNYHLDKTVKCEKAGIRLLQIFEDEYMLHRELVLDKVFRIVGVDTELPKIAARKCDVTEITEDEAARFLDNNHIQGFVYSSWYLGVYHSGRLVAVMTFKKTSDGKVVELNRFATDNRYRLQMIAGKMLFHFVRTHTDIREITSFADRRWTDIHHNMYLSLGFIPDGVQKPSYWYTDGHCERLHRFGFRKKILSKRYGLPMTMTEREMTESLGYYRIWDCGLLKYSYTNPYYVQKRKRPTNYNKDDFQE